MMTATRYSTVVAYNEAATLLDRIELAIAAADRLAEFLIAAEHPADQEASHLVYDLRRVLERTTRLRAELKLTSITEED
jgi:hypothetical protein